ncbi:hypothetical protein OV079_26090 [Nannocystis pusilla]|uniref:Uncharacterized protein n=1 Tax=Nannocystis pusilla TaxID=889268 RepID=A0A9X3IZD8_9BACT|nr:hypothetical protein [Nannocystis pusilla]MCY1008965.1 hypothetical protein [Nannocystis pusilla]
MRPADAQQHRPADDERPADAGHTQHHVAALAQREADVEPDPERAEADAQEDAPELQSPAILVVHVPREALHLAVLVVVAVGARLGPVLLVLLIVGPLRAQVLSERPPQPLRVLLLAGEVPRQAYPLVAAPRRDALRRLRCGRGLGRHDLRLRPLLHRGGLHTHREP